MKKAAFLLFLLSLGGPLVAQSSSSDSVSSSYLVENIALPPGLEAETGGLAFFPDGRLVGDGMGGIHDRRYVAVRHQIGDDQQTARPQHRSHIAVERPDPVRRVSRCRACPRRWPRRSSVRARPVPARGRWSVGSEATSWPAPRRTTSPRRRRHASNAPTVPHRPRWNE